MSLPEWIEFTKSERDRLRRKLGVPPDDEDELP
jgi:hypothetical protein